jgi:hypothetical protein
MLSLGRRLVLENALNFQETNRNCRFFPNSSSGAGTFHAGAPY